MRNIGLGVIACVLLSACMSQQDTASVEAAADRFHAHQAAGEDQAIYDEASSGFRDAARVEDLARLNAAVRGAAGCGAPARNPNAWNNTINTSGHFITLVYDRQCDGGPLTETFVFIVQGEQALLQNYNVAGMALFPTLAPAAPAPEAAPAESTPEPAPADQADKA